MKALNPVGRSSSDVQYLVVDDDTVSVMSIERAVKKLGLSSSLRIASNGEEAFDILRGTNGVEKILPPFVIILDLKMPRMGGHQFMDALRADEHLKNAVVFVLSTSEAPEDIERAYANNVAGYVIKDNAFDTFRQTISMIDLYANTVVLPKTG